MIFDYPTPEELVARAEFQQVAADRLKILQADGKMKSYKVTVTLEFTISPNIYGLVEHIWEEYRHDVYKRTYGIKASTEGLEQWYRHKVNIIKAPSEFAIREMSHSWQGLYRENEKIKMKMEEIK